MARKEVLEGKERTEYLLAWKDQERLQGKHNMKTVAS
jgi:hypothetical protein